MVREVRSAQNFWGRRPSSGERAPSECAVPRDPVQPVCPPAVTGFFLRRGLTAFFVVGPVASAFAMLIATERRNDFGGPRCNAHTKEREATVCGHWWKM